MAEPNTRLAKPNKITSRHSNAWGKGPKKSLWNALNIEKRELYVKKKDHDFASVI